MKQHRALAGLTALTLLLAAANGWVFANKEESGFLFRPASHDDLHAADSVEAFAYREEHYGDGECRAARVELQKTGLRDGEPDRERAHKIGAFLLRELDAHRGTPSAEMESMTPWQQYRAAREGEGGFWCTNFQDTYVFFATAAGVPSRKVKVETSTDGAGHSFAESWIDNRWAFVDLQSHKLEVRDAEGSLSAADLLRRHRRPEGLSAVVGASRTTVSYAEVSRSEQVYFTNTARLLYLYPYADPDTVPRKAFRYVVQPDRVLSPAPSDARHVVKLALFYAMLATGVLWVALAVRMVGRRAEPESVDSG